MRRGICALIIVALALVALGTAWAETEADFSDMTLEELYALRTLLDGEIERRMNGAGTTYPSGVYQVGRDVPAGDYLLGENPDALFAGVIVRAGEDEASAWLVYSPVNRQALIRLEPDTWLTLSECWARPLESDPGEGLVDGVALEGSYLAGVQIPAGSYTASIVDNAPLPSLSVYDGILGTGATLILHELLREDTPLTLREGDYVELSGCVLTLNE